MGKGNWIAAEAPHLLSSANVTLDLVKGTFTPDFHTYNNETFGITNMFALNLLNEYDKTNINDNLDLAIFIFDNMLKSLMTEENSHIATINSLQALYRKHGKLSISQNSIVIEIREHQLHKEDLMIKFCCHVLLEQIQDASYIYDQMKTDERNSLEDYPIFTLYKKQKS